MKRSISARITYFLLFILLLCVELLIALFAHDEIIRPYVGDVLIIPLLCALLRILFPYRPRLLGLYSIAAGVVAEGLQFFEIDKLMGVEDTVFGIILGSTFDVKDIVCYAIGGALFCVIELLARKKKPLDKV